MEEQTLRFKDKVVVVTGGTSGIGLATAKAFVAEGALVAITGRTSETVSAAAKEIDPSGDRLLPLIGDVSDPALVEAHARAVVDRFGDIDVLVNNAGIIKREPTEQVTAESWRQVMSVNVDGTFYWSVAVANLSMIPRKRGAIVNVASIGGMVGFPTACSYSTSKHAVIGMTKVMAVDWGQYKIRVNALCPGVTWSNLSKADYAKNPQHYVVREQKIPLGQIAQAEEQATCILFLASEEASYVSGLIMNVDGGQVALSSGHAAPRNSA